MWQETENFKQEVEDKIVSSEIGKKVKVFVGKNRWLKFSLLVEMWKGDLSTDSPVGWIDINDETFLNESRRKIRGRRA